jgi:hypothetical protein
VRLTGFTPLQETGATLISVITPCSPDHTPLLDRCIASVKRQKGVAKHIIVMDEARRGPGWARNTGLAQVDTPLVIFLDADDELLPTFCEETLAAFQEARGKRYIYTDWFGLDEKVIAAPDCAWVNKTAHCITTLLPTAWARAIGGFDEAFTGAEDTLFYSELVTRRMCGKRLAKPLFIYGKEGTRSKTFMRGGEYDHTMNLIREKVGGKLVACCGADQPMDEIPAGEQQTGDILATTLWNGNRQERGKISGRLYPRSGNGKPMWVNKDDVIARPDLWQPVDEDEMFEDILVGAQGVAYALLGVQVAKTETLRPAVVNSETGGQAAVIAKAKRAVHK